jgi:hypothetical protein
MTAATASPEVDRGQTDAAGGSPRSLATWVVAPTALAAVVGVAGVVANDTLAFGGAVVGAGALLALRRWPHRIAWVALGLGAWVASDVIQDVSGQGEVVLASVALLAAWALIGVPVGAPSGGADGGASRSWRAGAPGFCALSAALVAGHVAAGLPQRATLLAGFAVVVALAADRWSSVRAGVAEGAPWLALVGATGVAAAGDLAGAWSPAHLWAVGALGGGVAAALAARRLWLAVGIGVVAAGAAVWFIAPSAAGCELAMAGVGAAAGGLVAPGTWWDRLAARGPLAAWALVAANIAIAAGPVPRYVPGVVAAAAIGLALLVPWPGLLIRVARARAVVDPVAGVADRTRSVVLRGCRALDRAMAAGARPIVAVARWLAAPTWPERAPDRGGPRRGWVAASFAWPLGAWALATTLIPAWARLMANHFPPVGGTGVSALQGPFSVDPTGRLGWGTGDYWGVADHGYRLSEHREAVFPLVALVLRWLADHTGLTLLQAQVALASASSLVALLAFWALLLRWTDRPRVRVIALAVVVVYPWSFVLWGWGYADATLLALLLVSVLLAEHRRPVLAGLVGALATATRPNALPLVAGLLLFELVRTGALTWPVPGGWRGTRDALRLRRMGVRGWAVLLSLGGVVAYSAYLVGHAGSALYWLDVQAHYGHLSATQVATWLKVGFLSDPRHIVGNVAWGVNETATGVVLVGSAFLLPAVYRRLGPGWALLALGAWGIAWSGGRGFAPGARYLLPAVPFLVVPIAHWLSTRPRALLLTLAASIAGCLLLVATFSLGGSIWAEF